MGDTEITCGDSQNLGFVVSASFTDLLCGEFGSVALVNCGCFHSYRVFWSIKVVFLLRKNTRAFGELYSKANKEEQANLAARDALAGKVENLTAQWLPGDAYINGRQLGPDHVPKNKLPIIDSNLTTTPETALPPKATKSSKKRTQPRNAAGPKISAGVTAKV